MSHASHPRTDERRALEARWARTRRARQPRPPLTPEEVRQRGRAYANDQSAAQLARCEAILAAEIPPATWRRCDTCQGREWSERPHQHAA